MPDSRELLLPVVAHRILGAGSAGPVIEERMPVYEEDRRWIAWSATECGRPAPGKAPAGSGAKFKTAAHVDATRVAYVTPGTRRTIDEIRDMFDGGHRAGTSYDASINAIWSQAAIQFRLVAIVDHAIRSRWGLGVDTDLVTAVARDLNTPDVVNLYFFRDLVGGIGVAGYSPVPLQSTYWNVAFAAVEDWENIAVGEAGWNLMVLAAAHELGHLLNLRHHEDTDNLMYPSVGGSAPTLRPLQIMVAYEQARLYLPAKDRLRRIDPVFRLRIDDAGAEPLWRRAWRDGPLRFGGHS